MVRLNRAVAVAEVDGAAAALELLEPLDAQLGRTHGLWLARAELLSRLDRFAEARAAYERAAELATNAVVRAHLRERRAALG